MKQNLCTHGRKICEFSLRRLKKELFSPLALIMLCVLCVFPQAVVAATQAATQIVSEVSRTIDEDSVPRAFDLTLYGTDADSDTLKWSIAKPPENGVASIEPHGNNTKVNYQPNKNWNGTDSFFVQLADDSGGVRKIHIIVNVVAANDPPVNHQKPMIIGTVALGETIGVDIGEWDDSIDGEKGNFIYSYQWMRSQTPAKESLVPIPGATSEQYVLSTADKGGYLAVQITANDQGGKSSLSSSPSGRDEQDAYYPLTPVEAHALPPDALSTSALSDLKRVGNRAPMIALRAPEPPKTPAPPEAPKPPEKTIVLKGFMFDGNKSHTSRELTGVLSEYLNHPVTFNDLNAAASKVARYYRQTSHIIASAQIPAQEINQGLVRMVIIEGKLGNINVSGNTNYTSGYIRDRMETAVVRSPLSSSDIERGLMVLNQSPGLKVKSVLERGSQPGTVDVHVHAEDENPVKASLGYNNYGSEAISTHRYTLGLEAFNLWDTGGHLSSQVMVGKKPDELAVGSLTYDMPLGNEGLRVGISASYGDYDVEGEFADLDLNGDNFSGSLFASYPFILRQDLTVIGEIGIDVKNSDYYLLNTKMSKDRIRSIYVSGNAMLDLLGGKSMVAANLTQGLGSLMGGQSDDTNSSREGADNRFTRLQLSVAHNQPVCGNWYVYGSLSGQVTTNPLVSSEEWQIGGVGSVRGYAPGAQTGDQGYQSSLELRYARQNNLPWIGNLPWVAYSFIDTGYVRRDKPFVSQDKGENLTGAGIGGSLQYKVSGLTSNLTLNLGWPLDPSDNSLKHDPVLNINLSVDY